jgi:archaellum component FlaC
MNNQYAVKDMYPRPKNREEELENEIKRLREELTAHERYIFMSNQQRIETDRECRRLREEIAKLKASS